VWFTNELRSDSFKGQRYLYFSSPHTADQCNWYHDKDSNLVPSQHKPDALPRMSAALSCKVVVIWLAIKVSLTLCVITVKPRWSRSKYEKCSSHLSTYFKRHGIYEGR
jgi:hypothetical protein